MGEVARRVGRAAWLDLGGRSESDRDLAVDDRSYQARVAATERRNEQAPDVVVSIDEGPTVADPWQMIPW
jgi:hypothetical protein